MVEVTRLPEDGELGVVVVDGRSLEAGFTADGQDAVLVHFRGEAYRLEKPSPPNVEGEDASAAGAASLVAPMPGTVVKVMGGEGDEVEEGQPLLVLEAMKMEQTVAAPPPGP